MKFFFLLRTAFRNIWKYKYYNAINVFGLSVGMACFLLMFLYASDELSYDNYHENSDRIYRLVRKKSLAVSIPEAVAMAKDFGGIEKVVRVEEPGSKLNLEIAPNLKFSETVYFADSAFFEFFHYDFILGDAKALHLTNGIVLTESVANRFFGEENPLGKTITLYHKKPLPLVVTGVVKPARSNSHFHPGILISFDAFEAHANNRDNWYANSINAYFLLAENVKPSGIEAQIPDFFQKHLGETADYYWLQPLREAHLFSKGFGAEFEPQGDITYVKLFLATGILILLVAGINFMNLTTAYSIQRLKEISIKKVLGAGRRQLIFQLMVETFILMFISSLFAALWAWFSVPVFESLTAKDFTQVFSFSLLNVFWILLFIVLFTVLAGLYPALYISRLSPGGLLNSNNFKATNKNRVFSALVIGQFVISIFILIATMVVRGQLMYIQEKPLGFEDEAVVVVDMGRNYVKKFETLRNELLEIPQVKQVSATLTTPGQGHYGGGIRLDGMTDPEQYLSWKCLFVQPDYIKTLGIKVVSGRDFDEDLDSASFIINETGVKAMIESMGGSWASPIDKIISHGYGSNKGWNWRKIGRVVGVVEDFHFSSLHETVEPVLIQLEPRYYYQAMIKISPENMEETLQSMAQAWQTVIPDKDFGYMFLDERLESNYQQEKQTAKALTYLALLTALIACLGTYSLSTFALQRRNKEIGIRKVCGANAWNILMMSIKGSLLTILIAYLIAIPIAYYLMNDWLGKFAYSITLTPALFFGAGLITIVIVLLTISYNAIRATALNPVDILRHE